MYQDHLILYHPSLYNLDATASVAFRRRSASQWPKILDYDFGVIFPMIFRVDYTFRIDWLILLQSKGLSKSSIALQFRVNCQHSASLWSAHHIHTWVMLNIALTIPKAFVGKVMSQSLMLANIWSRNFCSLIPFLCYLALYFPAILILFLFILEHS